MEFIYSLSAAIIVSLISLVGILILIKKINPRSFIINVLISFAAGAIIGDAFIHLLPEYIELYGYSETLTFYIFFGIVFMFCVEAYFHSRHKHDSSSTDDRRPFLARLNLIGDGFHNFLDGMAIGASFLISPEVGVITTLAIVLHEIPQELADTSILLYSGWRRRKIIIANLLTALTSVLGVIFVFIAVNLTESAEQILIPFAIGQFLYISLATLVPEIHRSVSLKKYSIALGAFVFGIIVMYSLLLIEI